MIAAIEAVDALPLYARNVAYFEELQDAIDVVAVRRLRLANCTVQTV